MSVQEAYRYYRDAKFIVNRKYQRKLVWTVEEKQNLIDSIIKDYPIPLILLAEQKDKDSFGVYEVVDGLQRLNAIFSFIEHSFPYDGRYFDLKQFSRAKQVAESGVFSEISKEKPRLSPKNCADILDYQLAVTMFPSSAPGQVTDIFGRINSSGKQLSWQEKRQAGMTNSFAQLIRKLASEIRGDASLNDLVSAENSDRMIIYRSIAEKNGATLGEVQKLYATKLQSSAPAGTPIELVSGEWLTK